MHQYPCHRPDRPPAQRPSVRSLAALGLCVISLAAGCSGSGPESDKPALAAIPAAQPQARSSTAERPAALLNGQPIAWSALQPALAEAAGGLVLEEIVLDAMLDAELASRGLALTPAAVTAERRHLVDMIQTGAAADEHEAERLIDSLRRSRRLGDIRFRSLLERNAKLRLLTANTVSVTDAEVQQAFQLRYGPKFRARVILVPTEREAARIRDELASSPDHLTMRFAAAAARSSLDPSGPRGGILDPISPADPAYPAAIVRVLRTLEPGQLSPVVAVDRGYALVLLEEKLPPGPESFADVRSSLEREVRLGKERAAMEDLAARLLASAKLTVLDRSLEWGWRARRPAEP